MIKGKTCVSGTCKCEDTELYKNCEGFPVALCKKHVLPGDEKYTHPGKLSDTSNC